MISENKTAVTLGSFDGLHRGHMSVIACAFELQRERGLSPLVLLFDSHPMLTIMGKAPSMILQTELRDKLLSDLGAKTCIVPFAEIKDMTCREFFEKILIGRLNAGGVCCGWNYRFGKGNEGGKHILEKLCAEYGMELRVSPPIDLDGSPISSTRIRRAIESGDIPLANAMLGREFRYKLTVVNGDHRGRLMGAPTINQHFETGFVRPKKGVYASATVIENKLYPSVTNIGLRPSFENEDFRSETCILGFDGNLYGQKIEVRLLQYLRGEIRFESMDDLGRQIHIDAAKAKEIFLNRGENINV
ncbi:MAG: riboflavin biosynthesis protein RibF [Oscillospiraceae bacterium]|nr:riboflavin biosynthesis protein RibF [Oscillospiraceae bacterium]